MERKFRKKPKFAFGFYNPARPTWKIPPDDKETLKDLELIQKIVGEIIIQLVILEKELDKILINILIPKKGEERSLLYSSILTQSWCSSIAKCKALKVLTTQHSKLKKENFKSLRRDLRAVFEIRNYFAHGQIICENEKIMLCYFDTTTNQETKKELTKEFFQEFDKKLDSAKKQLNQITKHL